MNTISEVKKYIIEKFATDVTEEELLDDIDLLGTGIVTSISTVQLLGWTGRAYRVPINSIQIDPEDLRTPASIAKFIDDNRKDTLDS